MAKKSRDELWIDKLLKNYDRRKALTDRQDDYVTCIVDDCDKPYTFLVLDESPQQAAYRNHNKKLNAPTEGYISKFTGETYPYCDEHYLEYRKTATKEQLKTINKHYLL
jgi:hypothetical protein